MIRRRVPLRNTKPLRRSKPLGREREPHRRPRVARRTIKRRADPLEAKADGLFSSLVRRRDERCRRCHSRIGLECAHIVPRGYHHTRWLMDNALALCTGCHDLFTRKAGSRVAWVAFCGERIGAVAYAELWVLAYNRKTKPPTPAEAIAALEAWETENLPWPRVE